MARPIEKGPKRPRKRKYRRVNLKGLAIVGGVVLLLAGAYLPMKALSDRKVRNSALEQARASVKGQDVDLALRHLNSYLASWPNDLEALRMKARLLSEVANTAGLVSAAVATNDQLLRLEPNAPDSQEVRRRLVRFYLIQGEQVRRYAEQQDDPQMEAREGRFRAAVNVARDLIKFGAKDAEAHRLLALALDGLAPAGDSPMRAEAVAEFEQALKIDPGDAASAEKLAQIDLEVRKDPAAAERTLDELLKAKPRSVDVRMARHRTFLRAKQDAKAKAELDAAVALEPGNVPLRQVAAYDALRRKDTAGARAHFDAIPPASRDDLSARVLLGSIEFAEKNPDEAIDSWRKGLSSVGGSNLQLTWQLAYQLIQLDRLSEARPLVAQYERLYGDTNPAQGRFLAGLLEQHAGNPVKAIRFLEKARDKISDQFKGDLEFTMGRCYEALGDEQRALMAYRQATAASPRSAGPRRAIARLLQTRNPREAIAELDRALKELPDDRTFLYEVGRLRLSEQIARDPGRRDWSEVEKILDHAAEVAPGDADLQSLRVEYLAATGRMNDAIELLAKATRGPDGKRPEAWISWSTALDRTGRTDEALRVLERAAAPEAAGDHAALRIARARILVRIGKGQAAREVLAKQKEGVPRSERAELEHTLGDLLLALGDRDGSRAAYAEWARLAPDNPRAALTLLSLAQLQNDEEAARLGLAALKAVGGDQEPYGLAAQVIELLRTDRLRPVKPSPERLAQAEALVKRLQDEAPLLPVGHFLRGMIWEFRDDLAEAAASYKKSLKDDVSSSTMARLVDVLTRLKRFDELAAVRREYDDKAILGRKSDFAIQFDRASASASLRVGDQERAEYFASQIVDARPDNLQARTDQAQLLDNLGKPAEAEATLRALVNLRPDDPSSWTALVVYQALKRPPGVATGTLAEIRAKYHGERPELLLARCSWIAGDKEAAARLYASAVAKKPDDLVTLRGVTEFYDSTGRAADCEATLRKALKVDPSASWASRSLALRISLRSDSTSWAEAWALVAPGSSGSGDAPEDRLIRATILARCPEVARRSEAEVAFTSLADDLPASNPIAIEARARLAQAMLEVNQPRKAAAAIAPVADDENRPNPTALAISAEALARSGRPAEADRRLDRLAALEPKTTRTAMVRAWVLKAKGQDAAAAASVEAAFAAAESSPEGEAVGLAGTDLLIKLGLVEPAERLARRLAARWPRDSWLLATIQIGRKEFDRALVSCKAALAEGATAEALRAATSLALARRSDPATLKEVDAMASEAMASGPKTTEVLVFVATLRHVQARYEEEMALYRQALELNPFRVQFENNMAWTLSEGLGHAEEALTRIEDVIRREGPSPQFLDTRGVIRSRLGQHDRAIEDLERSAQGDPSATTYFHLARAYHKAGKPDEARRCRGLAEKAGFDPAQLDPTDRAELAEVMGKS